MKTLALFVCCASLMGQQQQHPFSGIDWSLANKPTVQLENPADIMAKVMRVRLMQEQERMMVAQREAFSRQVVEINFKEGYETGSKDGWENCRKVMLKGFEEYLPVLQQQIIQDAMRSIFTSTSLTDLQAAVAQGEVYLAANPTDYQKKGMILLFKARIAELTPPPPPPPEPPKKKKKAKT